MSKLALQPSGNIASNDDILTSLLSNYTANMKHDEDYLKRKQDLMMLDLETAHTWNQHTENVISNLRNINITLLVAYTGFFIQKGIVRYKGNIRSLAFTNNSNSIYVTRNT